LTEAERKAELEVKKKSWEVKMEKKEADKKAEKKAWEAEQLHKKQKAKEKERSDLLGAGFTPQQVDAIMNPKLAPRVYPGKVEHPPRTNTGGGYSGTESEYIKVHRDRICVETLTHYQIPWKYHEHDVDYVIMLYSPDIDLEILFDHTRRFRCRERFPFTRRPEDKLYIVRKPHRSSRWL